MNTFAKTNQQQQQKLFRVFYLHDTMAGSGGQYFGCIAKSLSTCNSPYSPSACNSLFVPKTCHDNDFHSLHGSMFPMVLSY